MSSTLNHSCTFKSGPTHEGSNKLPADWLGHGVIYPSCRWSLASEPSCDLAMRHSRQLFFAACPGWRVTFTDLKSRLNATASIELELELELASYASIPAPSQLPSLFGSCF
eukprot:364496-Chlamydomonas_euryale.AAC.31